MTFSNIISADALRTLEPKPIILDCRAKLGDPQWGRLAYQDGHIEGAIYLDLDADMAAPPDERGRHPLPDRADWLSTVRRLGISNDDQIVLYDDAFGAYAARAWWMFRWLGHHQVAVLDGGLQAWLTPLSVNANSRSPSSYSEGAPLTRLLDTNDLASNLAEFSGRLVDARTEERFQGRQEPIDPIAGHIPGATCLPFQGNLNKEGRFLSPDELRDRFAPLPDDAVCYCGSGVTACHNILAMHVAGLPEPTLYASSWSAWITNPSRPIETD